MQQQRYSCQYNLVSSTLSFTACHTKQKRHWGDWILILSTWPCMYFSSSSSQLNSHHIQFKWLSLDRRQRIFLTSFLSPGDNANGISAILYLGGICNCTHHDLIWKYKNSRLVDNLPVYVYNILPGHLLLGNQITSQKLLCTNAHCSIPPSSRRHFCVLPHASEVLRRNKIYRAISAITLSLWPSLSDSSHSIHPSALLHVKVQWTTPRRIGKRMIKKYI